MPQDLKINHQTVKYYKLSEGTSQVSEIHASLPCQCEMAQNMFLSIYDLLLLGVVKPNGQKTIYNNVIHSYDQYNLIVTF